ncbi:hypothetical protein HaLaN_19818 [Haematococcus lacustris]|uniref:Uncharacterized protein n=1 Tax=Haematococcus lacustris TaxID=44745 RepID=A0A6A0A0Q5_HAELA|nr:hypothetical protein HaLaN_19818 [Haematococcus lacustris]
MIIGSSPSCQPNLAVASQLAKAVADSVEAAFLKDAHGCLEGGHVPRYAALDLDYGY